MKTETRPKLPDVRGRRSRDATTSPPMTSPREICREVEDMMTTVRLDAAGFNSKKGNKAASRTVGGSFRPPEIRQGAEQSGARLIRRESDSKQNVMKRVSSVEISISSAESRTS